MLTWINYRKIYKTRRGCDTQKTTSPWLVVFMIDIRLVKITGRITQCSFSYSHRYNFERSR